MGVIFNTLNNPEDVTVEWYTPEYIIESLGGKFDLDPSAPSEEWYTAHKCYTKEIDGLSQKWEGRVFLNPPYSQPLLKLFVTKLADYGNGVALIYSRVDNRMFFDQVFYKATSVKFLRNRIKFIRPDGTEGDRPGCGSVLVAYGPECDELLRKCTLPGKYINLNN